MSLLPLQNIDNLISNVVNQYIVRPTGSISSQGISGFVFDILDDEQVMIDSDITDHFVEDNYAIQDHWAQRPIKFNLTGYVAELTDLFPNASISILTTIQSLNSIGGFFPTFSTQATQFYAKIAGVVAKVGQVVNQIKNVADIVNRYGTSATRQQQAYQTFLNIWLARQLCSIETPYGVFQNMAIESIRVTQKGTTKLISDFVISFKQINVVQTRSIVLPASPNPSGSGSVQPTTTQTSSVVNSNAVAFNGGGGPLTPIISPVKGRVENMIASELDKGQTQGTPTVPSPSPAQNSATLPVPPGFTPGAPLTVPMMIPIFTPIPEPIL